MPGITNGIHTGNEPVKGDTGKQDIDYLIAQNVDDPDVELFYGIINNDIIKVSEALQKGANPDATLSEVLQRHRRVWLGGDEVL